VSRARTQTILVSSQAKAVRARLEPRLQGLPVILDDLGSGPGDALIVAQYAADDVRAGLALGVRWIQSLATGVETVLIPEVLQSDVVVTNSSGATAGPVAEYTFGMILEHALGLRRTAQRQREHAWDRFFHDCLEGATLAVVGLGPIGRRVVRLGHAFGMRVLGVRRHPDAGAAGCDAVFAPSELAEVMADSDYVVLLAAVTPASQQLIDRRVLAAAKPGCLIVNVGRAELVDHEALLDAVRDGRVRAALDALPEEPLPPQSPWWDAPGTSISAHVAVWTRSMIDLITDLVADNITRFLAGHPLLNVVDKELGYVPSATLGPLQMS
jgi:phosphoglycerate dehydrogenase-like enzyme